MRYVFFSPFPCQSTETILEESTQKPAETETEAEAEGAPKEGAEGDESIPDARSEDALSFLL